MTRVPMPTKGDAVKRALAQLFLNQKVPAAASAAARRFIGSDKRPGDAAQHTKRLLREGRR